MPQLGWIPPDNGTELERKRQSAVEDYSATATATVSVGVGDESGWGSWRTYLGGRGGEGRGGYQSVGVLKPG